MALKINNQSDISLFQLDKSSKALSKSLERLSTGRRINQAADDSSGLIIANQLESQARGIGQSIRNANDAISISQVAEGALGEATNIVNNIRSLAVQANNGALSAENRKTLQAEINTNVAALNDIANNTSFNGQKLLSGAFSSKTFQTGTSAGESVTISIPPTTAEQLGGENGSLSDIDVFTQEGAEAAIAIADQALVQLDQARTDLGSTQNQLNSGISNLTTTQINLLAAESQVADVDLAEESMIFAKAKVLTQAKAFASAQLGKIDEKNVMNLLQG